MKLSKYYKKLFAAKEEKDVDNAYADAFMRAFSIDNIDHPYKCDGYIDTLFAKIIIEYKYDEDFCLPTARVKVLLQVLFYIKQFEIAGRELPNVIFVGDKNECFVLHTNDIINYLDEDVDWGIAPSNAHIIYPDLVLKMSLDTKINPFVFDITPDFDFKDVIEKISGLAENVTRYVRVTEHNLSNNYESFISKVIKHPDKIPANDLVAIYIGTIRDKENYFQHPTNPNILMANGKKVEIDGRSFSSFFSHFDRDYTPQELDRFAEIADRLIEDTKRRRTGEFYTPTPFVDYSQEMIGKALGDNWRNDYVVWDCCWGTGNLTRDYRFNELYASTLEEAELSIGERYNQESEKFIFDFLNAPLEGSLLAKGIPSGLMEAIKQNKPIIFYINPPYASASSDFGKNGGGKGNGATDSYVTKLMVKEKLGNASNNLYAQFIYRILLIKKQYSLTNLYIGLFCNPAYLSGSAYEQFRKHFLKEFNFIDGILFNAGHFSGVSASWGINFSIWQAGETIDKHCFIHTLVDEVDGRVVPIGEKVIYNIDGMASAKEWIKAPIKGIKVIDKPTFSNAITLTHGKNSNTKIADNALGCYSNMGNNVDQNQMKVSIFSSSDSSNANGMSILPENYDRVMALFAARKLIDKNWVNSKDEYLVPDVDSDKYSEFLNDSIVFGLFNTSSNQASLRNICYNDKTWTIKNEFFFMSVNSIKDLAVKENIHETYDDARTDTDRYTYKLLKSISLSEAANAVLLKAIDLIEKSFKYRSLFDMEHPEYQIKNWDSGWYQIKAMIKAYMPSELECFNTLYNNLANKMRPMVYELGFLKP